MLTVILYLIMLQDSPRAPAPRFELSPFEVQEALGGAADLDYREAKRRAADFERQEFIRKYNKLIRTLREFAKSYNQSRVVDLKQIKTLNAALKGLEKSESWLQMDSH